VARTSKRIATPDWATSILNLRRHLRLTQSELGSRLHYSAMAVSRWETGKQEPTSQCYIQLGNLAGEPDCWFFWGRAGLSSSDIESIFPGPKAGARMSVSWPDFDIVRAGSGRRNPATMEAIKPKMVAVPLLDVHAGALGEPGSHQTNFADAMIDQMIAAPALWCLNPSETNCLRVRGRSMSPLINDGDIVAVDGSVTDPKLLHGKIVVAWHRETGLALARFLVIDGVHLLESENREYMPVPVEKDRNWRIVGKVLWWIRLAP
jgi:SOS-response transcriptional repressor LexA/DNA-binding XRE family transcriptional regulator